MNNIEEKIYNKFLLLGFTIYNNNIFPKTKSFEAFPVYSFINTLNSLAINIAIQQLTGTVVDQKTSIWLTLIFLDRSTNEYKHNRYQTTIRKLLGSFIEELLFENLI